MSRHRPVKAIRHRSRRSSSNHPGSVGARQFVEKRTSFVPNVRPLSDPTRSFRRAVRRFERCKTLHPQRWPTPRPQPDRTFPPPRPTGTVSDHRWWAEAAPCLSRSLPSFRDHPSERCPVDGSSILRSSRYAVRRRTPPVDHSSVRRFDGDRHGLGPESSVSTVEGPLPRVSKVPRPSDTLRTRGQQASLQETT